jgi:hypothetical protein
MKKLILAAFALTTAVSVFAQGTIVFNNRISGATVVQTSHIWGPAVGVNSTIALVGLGSNDNPVGATAYAVNGMRLIGDGGTASVATGDGNFVMGYKTTFAQLLGIVGQNGQEASLLPLNGVTTFRTGSSLGDVAAINSTMNNQPTSYDAAWATIELVAWDGSPAAAARAAGFNLAAWGTKGSKGAYDAWQGGLIAGGVSGTFNVANIGGSSNPTPVLTSGGAVVPGLSFNLYYVPEPSMFALAGLGAAALMIFRRRK